MAFLAVGVDCLGLVSVDPAESVARRNWRGMSSCIAPEVSVDGAIVVSLVHATYGRVFVPQAVDEDSGRDNGERAALTLASAK